MSDEETLHIFAHYDTALNTTRVCCTITLFTAWKTK